MKPVCLVIGAGAGIGGRVARRFAQKRCGAVLCVEPARRLGRIESIGGRDQRRRRFGDKDFSSTPWTAGPVEERVAAVEADIGPIEVAVYNLGAQIGDRALKDTWPRVFETGWRLGTFGLFRLAAAVCSLIGGARQRNTPCDLIKQRPCVGQAVNNLMRLPSAADACSARP